MTINAANMWKLGLAAALALSIFISAYATAPKESVAGADLRRLVFSAVALYLVGLLASVTHHALPIDGSVWRSGLTYLHNAVRRWRRPTEPAD